MPKEKLSLATFVVTNLKLRTENINCEVSLATVHLKCRIKDVCKAEKKALFYSNLFSNALKGNTSRLFMREQIFLNNV